MEKQKKSRGRNIHEVLEAGKGRGYGSINAELEAFCEAEKRRGLEDDKASTKRFAEFVGKKRKCAHCGRISMVLEGMASIMVEENIVRHHYGRCAECGWMTVECALCLRQFAVSPGHDSECGCGYKWGVRGEEVVIVDV